MSKLKTLWLCFILFCITLTSCKAVQLKEKLASFAGSDAVVELNLEWFEDGESFKYKSIPWDSSVDEVETTLGLTLTEPQHLKVAQNEGAQGDWKMLSPNVPVKYSSYNGDTIFEFKDDKLQSLKITFQPQASAEDVTAMYNQLVKEAVELYGKQTEDKSRENAVLGSKTMLTASRWDLAGTTLQIMSIEGEKVKPSVTIAVGKLPE